MIYFLCHSDPENYQWDIIPLGEGLEELGVPFSASANYWLKPDGSFLFKKNDSVKPLDCDAIIVSTGFLNWITLKMEVRRGELPPWMLEPQKGVRPVVVGLDTSDNYLSPITTEWVHGFDIILRSQYNRRFWWPDNVKPWAYGLTNRILQSAEKSRQPWEQKKGCMFVFGASHRFSHVSREWAAKQILPELSRIMPIDGSMDDLNAKPEDAQEALLWKQCNRRHLPGYFARLGSSRACAAFCGDLIPAFPANADYLVGGNKAKLKRVLWGGLSQILLRPMRNVQPDSLRFWEALASGAAVLHLDALETGWELPVAPVAFETYLPASLSGDNRRLFDTLRDEEALMRISENGRAWAMQHYSPRKAAERLLAMLEAFSR